ncbi:similar to Saccharomyces cerevisiae YFR013W IOC3 Member of a complex (Isw1a) with Isw1p [Maudiozyma barnettii]|uniref:Similar to Saccharomyces cerevisiae YFR013W IOC3 Member of a complex (Isw1a) with Isw1p n=1 Tax=Maudiozyma barnettii TaxID=61262 RepID=A0A8H2VEW4_9SACH|nr:uncharacterized protein KABA2_04S02024 [Kazachstania barnettii]CAB4254251.1 similar to Saccharomyces cerevisiae YFR013W IOC3 Member of a complex (Isw1a) with Isw1p [Kazachstania barnettii]CAD1782013.1 similar to Saccharomyces cerevisiae YFR013W IOC3 Member of a complex (Isw1a) with Isw1p [Kazachstania barnettii]
MSTDMKEVIDLESKEKEQQISNDSRTSLNKADRVMVPEEEGSKVHKGEKEHPEFNGSTKQGRSQKPKGQMTFADFKKIAIIKAKSGTIDPNGTKIRIKISDNIPKVITSRAPTNSVTPSKSPTKSPTPPKSQGTKSKSKSTTNTLDPAGIPKKRGTYSDLESNRYKILKTEHHKKVPSLKTLQSLYWAPNLPLMNDDFRFIDNKMNEMWTLQFCNKPERNAKDILKIMAFINKFSQYFDENLKNITYPDFSIGLSLGTTDETTGQHNQAELEHIQSLMNFIFFNLLKLLFSINGKKNPYNVPTLQKFMNIKQPFGKMVGKLHTNIKEWGSPKEWRYDLSKEEDVTDDNDNDLVDPSLNEILFETKDMLPLHPPYQDEYHPLFMKSRSIVDAEGIYAVDTFRDRVVALNYLVDLNISYSALIHEEVNNMSHCRKDQHFTHLVPNFLKEGFSQTIEDFTDLCESIVIYINAKRASKYDRYKANLPILDKVRAALVSILKTNSEERKAKILSMYDKWVILLSNTVPENPLSDPYLDDSAKLRLQEFFVVRVNEIGDFYIPRMNTYDNPHKYTNFYVDLLSLLDLFKMYANNEIDDRVINEEFEKSGKPSFSLLYRNSAKMTNDWFLNNGVKDENYWYEICHDSQSLQIFKTKIEGMLSGTESNEISTLLKDNKYQDTKRTLSILYDYLNKIYPIIEKFENLKPAYKDQYSIDNPGNGVSTRRSTRGHQNRVNYALQSDDEFENEIHGESDADFVNGSESVYDEDGQQIISSTNQVDVGADISDGPIQKMSREQRLQSRRDRN